jgi:arsenate reductase
MDLAAKTLPFKFAGSTMTTITIYHNPRCSKSRQTLALLQERDVDIQVVEYLQTPLDADTIRQLTEMLGIDPRDLIRDKEYRALNLEETVDPAELIRRMVAHPEIIQRPIVVNGDNARIGRPPENVLEIL